VLRFARIPGPDATIGRAFGGLRIAGPATVTLTDLCLPSETLAWLERRPGGHWPD
jgi:hypothetical protein